MKQAKSRFVSAAAAVMLAAPISVFIVSPAQADEGHWSRSRNGCVYTGGISSDHRYAWTAKTSGNCAGHAYLKMYWDYDKSWEGHHEKVISRSGTLCPDPNFCQMYHKTQSNESWGQSH